MSAQRFLVIQINTQEQYKYILHNAFIDLFSGNLFMDVSLSAHSKLKLETVNAHPKRYIKRRHHDHIYYMASNG